jgi:type II secretory pathway pseudopilin PulG
MSINSKHCIATGGRGAQNSVRGFILLEQMVAMSIGVIVSMLLVVTAFSVMSHVRHIAREREIHATALFIGDTFTYHIHQAQDARSVSGTSFQVVSPSKIITVNWQNKELFFDGNKLHNDRVRISNFWYRIFPRSVQYGFTITSASSTEKLSATTSVAFRR